MSASSNSSGGGGRGRPPVHSRFQPGQSGNPKGRPKGSRNLLTLINAELARIVPVAENGKSRRISKAELAAKQLVNQIAGAKADPRVTIAVLRLFEQQAAAATAPSPAEPATSALGGEDDQELVRAFYQQARETTDEPD